MKSRKETLSFEHYMQLYERHRQLIDVATSSYIRTPAHVHINCMIWPKHARALLCYMLLSYDAEVIMS